MSGYEAFKAKIRNRKHPNYGEWGEARFVGSGCQSDRYKIILDDGEEIEPLRTAIPLL